LKAEEPCAYIIKKVQNSFMTLGNVAKAVDADTTLNLLMHAFTIFILFLFIFVS